MEGAVGLSVLNKQNGPARVAQFRADKLRHYLRRAQELQSDERRLHDSLDTFSQL